MTTRRVLGQCVHLGAVLLLIGADAAAFPTAQSREFLVVGNGPVSDSSGEFTNAGVGSAVDVSQFELGANQRTVPSPTDPSLAGNVPLLPVGAAPVGVGVVGDGNVAVTHPGGVFTLSNVDLFADLGIRCAAGAAACTDGASNSFVNPPGPGIPAGGVAGNQSFSGLVAELTAARAQIPGLAATSVLDVGASGGKIASDTTLQLAPGLNVVDIVTGGADFLLENANLVVDGPPGAVAILRVDPSANFLVSNGNVVVGSGGIGLNHVVFVSLKSDNATHFSVSNAVLNGVAFWDLGAGGSSISVQNAQGCTQWIGDKVSLQDVRFSRCAFEGPVCPAGPDQDADGDGVGDACDSCPFVANSDQSDIGGIGADSGPDGIGDACQCGDVTGDGFVTLSDAVVIARSQLQPPAAVPAKAERCDVGGGTGPTGSTCTLADAVIVRRALLSPAAATIQPVCAGAE